MMSSVAINGVLGFIMLITLCFTLGEVDKVLNTPTNFPFIQIFYNTTGSIAATNAMTAVLVITLTASTITEVATASRQLWSFARDEGLPFSSFFAYVSHDAFTFYPFVTFEIHKRCRATYINKCAIGHARLEHPP